MALVYLGIGSNLEPDRQLPFALHVIEKLGRIQQTSPTYKTEPLGPGEQAWYHNCVVALTTDLAPEVLLAALKRIEQQAGRKVRPKWSARELDIDILLYDLLTIDTVSLHIPHLELTKRKFVLQPLSDIAPQLIEPRSGKTIAQLIGECHDTLQIERL